MTSITNHFDFIKILFDSEFVYNTLDTKIIHITKQGFKLNDGIYIGRGSIFGNPFPTKRSKYSTNVYSLKESLILYHRYFLNKVIQKTQFHELVETFITVPETLVLNCFCINRVFTFDEFQVINNKGQIPFDRFRCHGEIIAFYIFFYGIIKLHEFVD
jgi:hypothetical protein